MEEETQSQENKYKNELASVVAGSLVGAVLGVADDVVAAVAGIVATGIVAGIGVVANEDLKKPRHLIIGGLAGLAMYGAVTFGGYVRHNSAKDEALIPFQTEIDRGVIVERYDGTQSPYIFDASGNYVHMKNLKNKDLSSLTQSNLSELERLKSDYEKREFQIYETVKEK